MTTPATFRKRLLKLADFLETRKVQKRFKYNHWVGEDYKGAADLSCGTTACALGWATTMPCFRRLGLRLEYQWDGYFEPVLAAGGGPSDVAAHVFGLNVYEYGYLFLPGQDKPFYTFGQFWDQLPKRSPGRRATAKQVAAHIRKFVAAKYPTSKPR